MSVRRVRFAAIAASILVSALALADRQPVVATVTPPTYAIYPAPSGKGTSAGEPSIGVNWTTGAVMYQAGTRTYRVESFGTGGVASWTDVSPLTTQWVTLDPILYTDRKTGRTFVSQLTAVCSLFAFTDNDGRSWTENPAGCSPGAMVDHQSVGAGPFVDGSVFRPVSTYPNAVYYCAQALLSAQCGVSMDGGLTFAPAVPVYGAAGCVGVHGHVRTAPDRAVWIPHQYCAGEQAVIVSRDGGLTWTVNAVPNSTSQAESDPSVAVDSGGRGYLCMESGQDASGNNGFAQVATTTDHGEHWSAIKTLSATIKNVQFPAVIAGTSGRAACAFLGTTTAGDDQSPSFKGVWSLYVATTDDGGATWTLVNATGTDPVHRGPICLSGTTCASSRNLKDFMDIAIDKAGRVYVAFADGCIGACKASTGTVAQSTSALATIARQTGGTLLCSTTTCP